MPSKALCVESQRAAIRQDGRSCLGLARRNFSPETAERRNPVQRGLDDSNLCCVRRARATRLFHIACSLIRQVNSEQTIVDSWSFGGGTAMMLQIDHRESHDIDIFLPDAQLLPLFGSEAARFRVRDLAIRLHGRWVWIYQTGIRRDWRDRLHRGQSRNKR
jgi:hypothetical protein